MSFGTFDTNMVPSMHLVNDRACVCSRSTNEPLVERMSHVAYFSKLQKMQFCLEFEEELSISAYSEILKYRLQGHFLGQWLI